MTKNETAGWHRRLNAHEFEQMQEIAKDREAWHASRQPMGSRRVGHDSD